MPTRTPNRIPQTPQSRRREFWEPQDYRDYFTQQPQITGQLPGAYDVPRLDVAALQEQAMAPARREYERAVGSLGARMGKRKMGRSGAYVQGELDELYKYLAGGPGADIALRAEELAQRERLGLAELGQRERELALRERLGLTELGLQDRQFEQNLELQWANQGLNEQEIADRKEMFYAEQKQLSDQFNRNYTLRETEAMHRHMEELGRQGLTQQQIDNEMKQFDDQLAWEKEHYGFTLDEERRQFNENLAFQLQQLAQDGEIEFSKLNETMRQFDENMKRLATLDKFEIEARERGMDMEWWQMQKAAELEEIKLDMMNNEIFGFWDEGFDPEGFDGEKYEWDEETETWQVTAEWDKYMLDHYHPGQLDLREWELRLETMLGMRGMTPREEEGPPTESDIWKDIDGIQKEIDMLKQTLKFRSIDPGLVSESFTTPYDDWSDERIKARIKELTEEMNALRNQVSGQPSGGGGR